MKKSKLPIKHLIDMSALTSDIILDIFQRTQYFSRQCKKGNVLKTLADKQIINLFFEASTRTSNSFTIAAKRLGAILLNPTMSLSATAKGESLLDTIYTLEAMGTNLFVIRHCANHTAQFLASELKTHAAIINAGDGNNHHPTQGLLDLFTIQQHKPDFTAIKVAILGDILHSRVARSLIEGLKIMGTRDICIIAPASLTPPDNESYHVNVSDSVEAGLKDADVIVTLRLQKERMQSAILPDPETYYQEYGLTAQRLAFAKPDAIVMHPGPINRGVEIDSSVADGPQSVILEQVQNGIALRMAVMDGLLA
jgi:aspartate carbamoyltransferase catalytic subunit